MSKHPINTSDARGHLKSEVARTVSSETRRAEIIRWLSNTCDDLLDEVAALRIENATLRAREPLPPEVLTAEDVDAAAVRSAQATTP